MKNNRGSFVRSNPTTKNTKGTKGTKWRKRNNRES